MVCFMEIDMKEMLQGVSMHSQNSDTTFSNIYTSDGVALTGMILGGLAEEDNLLDALAVAEYEKGYSYEKVKQDFEGHVSGEASFSYNGIRETLDHIPVEGTDWMLTYLIRESAISRQISSISQNMLIRSIIQSVVTTLVLIGIFAFIIRQNRRNAELRLEKETADAEARVKQQELDERIAMQNKIEEQSHALSEALAVAEDASRAKTVFLSNMSHEIRTPMNAIIGLDNIALGDPDTPPKTREYLEKIGVSAEHLLHLINDILDMSRIESGRMVLKNEEFSFQQLLEAINTMFSGQCTDKGLEYHCHVNGQICDYYIGDNMKLRQILINILGNAVKFTPEGGKVELKIRPVNAFDGHTSLEFVIEDNGIGISKDFLPHIFDSFAQEEISMTGEYGSSGLGMAITKSFVEMMNGNIKVESEKGKGTVFTVTVTLMDSDRKAVAGKSEEIDVQKMSVLIVDDDPLACDHAKVVLEKAGIASETAASGEEALDKVNLRNARMEPYNLILMDWKMPGMDGVETTRKIREVVGDKSAIIILTAYRSAEALIRWKHPELEKRLLDIIKENGLTTDELMLEITESAYADDAKGLKEVVKGLRALGFKIEMDDFGTGYSSLNMITDLPIDVLKIDMQFIRNMNKDEKGLKLVELVMDIAKFLGVPAVAEGVEDASQVEVLKNMGCEVIQGYYFSKPVPPEEFEPFIVAEKEGK